MTADVRDIHASRPRKLTLSEVRFDPERGRPQAFHTRESANITPEVGNADQVALAIAAHLSPRAGGSLAAWDRPGALETRAAFIRQAIDAAARCPLCELAVRHG